MTAATLFRKLFPGSAEKLQKDPLLDVFVFVNRRSDGPGQSLIDVGLLGELFQEFDAVFPAIQTSAKEKRENIQ